MNLKSVIDLQMILKIFYWGARLNFMFSLPQLHNNNNNNNNKFILRHTW